MDEFARRGELAELAALHDLVLAMPGPIRQGLAADVRLADGALGIAAARIPLVTFNRIIGLGLCGPADLVGLTAWARQKAAPVVQMQVAPDVLTDKLVRGLGAQGWHRNPIVWAKLYRSTYGAQPEAGVEEIFPDQAMEFGTCIQRGFAMPDALAPWIASLVGRAGWHGYGIRLDGRFVSGGFLHIGPEGGWLGIAATLPEARGRGYQKCLQRHRLAMAAAAGQDAAFTETGRLPGPNPSLANMLATGFQLSHDRVNFTLAPEGAA